MQILSLIRSFLPFFTFSTFSTFFAQTSHEGGATAMANPLYQDPYYEDDGPMSEF